jgi:hypothetical protein
MQCQYWTCAVLRTGTIVYNIPTSTLTTAVFLDVICSPVSIITHNNFSETGFCLHHQEKTCSVGPHGADTGRIRFCYDKERKRRKRRERRRISRKRMRRYIMRNSDDDDDNNNNKK